MGKKHMTEAERSECIALYTDGSTLDQLAERYNRARNTINRLITRRRANRGHKFRVKGPKWSGYYAKNAEPAKIPFAGKD